MSNSLRILMIWLLVACCASLTFLSFDFNAHRQQAYQANLTVEPGSGPVTVVFYAGRWATYRGDGSITGDLSDWQVTEQSDSTVVTSRDDRAALHLHTWGTPLYISLLHIGGAGTAVLTDALGNRHALPLAADAESIESFMIGGESSAVPAIPGTPLAPRVYWGLYALILAVFAVPALYQVRIARGLRPVPPPHGIRETIGFAAPLLLTPLMTQLAYWPASTAYDGGLQWLEAAVPGQLTEAIVIPATLLFRKFATLSPNPAWLLFAQNALAAGGIVLLLHELRWRGVPRWAAQGGALCIALTPQYPTFIAVIAKDAWNLVGLVYAAAFALTFLRRQSVGAPAMLPLVLMGMAAVFAGLMRPNTLVPIAVFMLAMALRLRRQRNGGAAFSLFAVYLTAALVMPGIIVRGAAESPSLPPSVGPADAPAASRAGSGMPLGVFANIYIFHLYAALQHSGVPIEPADAALFTTIAPSAAWSEYDCAVSDKTRAAVSEASPLEAEAFAQHLSENQVAMARVVAMALLRDPGVLLQHQACVSRLIWYIGYGLVPFQANATLGYDHPPPGFAALAGENRSRISTFGRQLIDRYVAWSESWGHRWLFWRPFLYVTLGVFAVALFSIAHRRSDVLLVSVLPLALTLSLVVLIPFPAFRYQYPATLLFTILALLALARPGPMAPTQSRPPTGGGAP